jgi:hypothetical protein
VTLLNKQISLTQLHVEKYQATYAFFLVAVIYFIYSMLRNITVFPFDSGVYWYLSKSFFSQDTGEFSLLNFEQTYSIRGYFFSLLLAPVHQISLWFKLSNDELFIVFRLYSALFSSYGLTIILPSLFAKLFKVKLTIISRLMVPITILVFWPGLILYPLTDLYSSIMFIGVLLLLLVINKSDKITLAYVALLSCGAGLLSGGLYNTRTVYLIPLAVLILFLPFLLKNKSRKLNAVVILCFIIGLIIVSLPQCIINQKYYNTFTPKVIMSNYIKDTNLFYSSLGLGIYAQRYETVVKLDKHPQNAVIYNDAAGQYVMKKENIGTIKNLKQYLNLVFKYPIEFAGIYTRHVFNYFDARYGDIYYDNVRDKNYLLFVFNYIFLYLGAHSIRLFYPKIKPNSNRDITTVDNSLFRRLKMNRLFFYFAQYQILWIGVWLIPAIIVIPGHVEARYFFQAYLLIYSVMFYGVSLREIIRHLKSRPLKSISLFLIGFFIFCAVTDSTISTIVQ